MSARFPVRNNSGSAMNVGNPERVLSALGGAALLLTGFKRRGALGVLQSFAGSALLYRGVTGQCSLYKALKINTYHGQQHADGIHIVKTVLIAKPKGVLYDYWKHLQNLPQFMAHLLKVEVKSDGTSHWVAKAPGGTHVSWDAKVINDVPHELLAWESLPGSTVPNVGSVRFQSVGNGETQVTVNIQYHPPGGVVGDVIAKLFGEDPASQIADDLRRFKSIMETGQVLHAVPSQPLPKLSN